MEKKSIIRVGLNGTGRIGRTVLRQWCDAQLLGKNLGFEIVALNNPGDFEVPVHLLNYDSSHGVSANFEFALENASTIVAKSKANNGKSFSFACLNKANPQEINWSDYGVDIVIDGTGKFKDKESLSGHLQGTVKKVILCAPGKNVDATIVMGANQGMYNPFRHHIISNASCTTNCLAPIIKVLHDNWKIEKGLVSTVHAYTSDQNILDGRHKDLRRARSAACSIIPTNTGAARALGKVFPELEGKFDGIAYRVPTPNVSVVDLTVTVLEGNPTIANINEKLVEAANGELNGILGVCSKQLVSIDYNGRKESSIVDLSLTNIIHGMIKVVAWYDNEVGFSSRVLDLTEYVSKGMK